MIRVLQDQPTFAELFMAYVLAHTIRIEQTSLLATPSLPASDLISPLAWEASEDRRLPLDAVQRFNT